MRLSDLIFGLYDQLLGRTRFGLSIYYFYVEGTKDEVCIYTSEIEEVQVEIEGEEDEERITITKRILHLDELTPNDRLLEVVRKSGLEIRSTYRNQISINL